MRSLPLTFCAAIVAGTIALPASAASAGSKTENPGDEKRSGTVSVSPSRVSPGGEVELRVDVCGKDRSARGNSEAFASEARFELLPTARASSPTPGSAPTPHPTTTRSG